MKIPQRLTLAEIQGCFQDIQRIIRQIEHPPWDMHGQRVSNGGRAVDAFDFVTKFDVQGMIAAQDSVTAAETLLRIKSSIRVGTFTTRGAPIAFPNQMFVASDLDYLAWVSDGANWIYAGGMRSVTQANLSAFAANLGTSDARLITHVTDYDHVLKWSGSAWGWAPGSDRSGYSQLWEAAPSGYGSLAWQVYDGSTVAKLNSDGTTSNVTLDNLGTAGYLKGGTAAAAVAAASGATAAEAAHTHSVDPPSTASGAPSGTVAVQAGAGTTVATDTHTHNTDVGSFSSGAGSSHTHGPGTQELRNKQFLLYFRR